MKTVHDSVEETNVTLSIHDTYGTEIDETVIGEWIQLRAFLHVDEGISKSLLRTEGRYS